MLFASAKALALRLIRLRALYLGMANAPATRIGMQLLANRLARLEEMPSRKGERDGAELRQCKRQVPISACDYYIRTFAHVSIPCRHFFDGEG